METNISATLYQRIGIVARWQPPHLGHAAILNRLCNSADHVLIGIGSSNTYNYRCPFTFNEVSDMLHLILANFSNYTLIPVPDLHNGPRWRLMVLELFPDLDAFITANPYVASLMQEDYPIIHPASFLDVQEQIPVEGQMVRRMMAQNGSWQSYVPEAAAFYMMNHQIDSRFRKEFGLQTLAVDTIIKEG